MSNVRFLGAFFACVLPTLAQSEERLEVRLCLIDENWKPFAYLSSGNALMMPPTLDSEDEFSGLGLRQNGVDAIVTQGQVYRFTEGEVQILGEEGVERAECVSISDPINFILEELPLEDLGFDFSRQLEESQRRERLLSEQVAALRSQLTMLQGALETASEENLTADRQIDALGTQLNAALARLAAMQREIDACERTSEEACPSN
jgi:hypothetical protein